jgi:HEAT repeat protein
MALENAFLLMRNTAEVFMRVLYLLLLLLLASMMANADTVETADPVYQARLLLNQSIDDGNPDTRKHAAQALGLIGPREPYLGLLIMLSEDKDILVRTAAVNSMADIRSPEVVAPLRKALDDEVPEVSFAAAKALWSMEDPAGRDFLIDVLGGDVKAKSSAFTQKRRETMRMFRTPKPLMMFLLRRGASYSGVPGLGRGISSLEGILLDSDISGRGLTALLLGNDNHPDILAALQDALSDKNWSVRAAASHAIALQNDVSMQPALIPLLEDKKEAVRVRAAAAYLRLELIKTEEAIALKTKMTRKERNAMKRQQDQKDF